MSEPEQVDPTLYIGAGFVADAPVFIPPVAVVEMQREDVHSARAEQERVLDVQNDAEDRARAYSMAGHGRTHGEVLALAERAANIEDAREARRAAEDAGFDTPAARARSDDGLTEELHRRTDEARAQAQRNVQDRYRVFGR